MQALAEISGHVKSKLLKPYLLYTKKNCGGLRIISSLLWALEAEYVMKVTVELFSSLFTEPVSAGSDKESSNRSCTWFMHLPAVVSAQSVSTCGWYGWSLEHTARSHSTFPETCITPVQSSITQLGGVDPCHNESGETKLPMAYIKNHYKWESTKTGKQQGRCTVAYFSSSESQRENLFFFW